MDMFEEARSLAGTMKMRKMTQSEMAKILGVSQSYIANKLRLLQLNTDMQKQILSFGLSERHARALLKLNSESVRQAVLDRICDEHLSVARTEALVDFYHCTAITEDVGKAGVLEKTDLFLDNLSGWLSLLSSAGAKTSKKISYEGSKMYITICINQG